METDSGLRGRAAHESRFDRKRVPTRRRYDIIGIVIAVALVTTYASVRSEYHLRSQMPQEFFDSASVPASKRAAEERIAEAYWKCAVNQIQWEYGYAHRLPEEAPGDFQAPSSIKGATDPAARARYWQKLRTVWTLTSAWEQHYEWSTISLRESLQSAGTWLQKQMSKLTGY